MASIEALADFAAGHGSGLAYEDPVIVAPVRGELTAVERIERIGLASRHEAGLTPEQIAPDIFTPARGAPYEVLETTAAATDLVLDVAEAVRDAAELGTGAAMDLRLAQSAQDQAFLVTPIYEILGLDLPTDKIEARALTERLERRLAEQQAQSTTLGLIDGSLGGSANAAQQAQLEEEQGDETEDGNGDKKKKCGPCEFAHDLDSRGRRCGARSAEVRSGGCEPGAGLLNDPGAAILDALMNGGIDFGAAAAAELRREK